MKSSKTVFLAALVLAACSTHALAITNGEIDLANRYANVGAIVGLPKPGSGGSPVVVCSGTLIHERVLLTAGHCTARIEALLDAGVPIQAFQVSFGVYAYEPATWHQVAGVVTHPRYSNYEGAGGVGNPHDIGVVILAEPVMDIAPAALPLPGLLDDLRAARLLESTPEGDSPLTAAGYGRTLDFPPPETVPIDGYRRFAHTEYLGLTQAYLMAAGVTATGDGGGGSGDSGGPIFWTDPLTGQDTLVAVHIWTGDEHCPLKVEYRADIPDMLDFVACVYELLDAGVF